MPVTVLSFFDSSDLRRFRPGFETSEMRRTALCRVSVRSFLTRKLISKNRLPKAADFSSSRLFGLCPNSLLVLELFLPSLDPGLCAEVFGFGFVAAFDPDPREAGVDMDVVGLDGVGTFSGFECLIEVLIGQVDLGEGVKGGEIFGVLSEYFVEFLYGCRGVAHSEVKSRFFDNGLQVADRIILVLWHGPTGCEEKVEMSIIHAYPIRGGQY